MQTHIIKASGEEITQENIENIAGEIHQSSFLHKVNVFRSSEQKKHIVFEVHIITSKADNIKTISYFNGREPLTLEKEDEVFYVA